MTDPGVNGKQRRDGGGSEPGRRRYGAERADGGDDSDDRYGNGTVSANHSGGDDAARDRLLRALGPSGGDGQADGAQAEGPAAKRAGADGAPAGGSATQGTPAESPAGNPPGASAFTGRRPAHDAADPGAPRAHDPSDDGDAPLPFPLDESALRRLMQSAVGELEPSERALDDLRRAIPARRARKRQALVGVAAAIVLAGTGVPAAVHISADTSSSSSAATHPGTGPSDAGGGADGSGDGVLAPGAVRPAPSGSAADEGEGAAADEDHAGAGATRPGPVSADAPPCEASQLGDATATTNAPQPDGTVYGTFRVANVSGAECAVNGSGQVLAAVEGGVQRQSVPVVEHAAGDAASGLPPAAVALETMVLRPGTAYEVRFAWVPAPSCPPPGGDGGGNGGTGEPSGEPSPTSSPDPSVTPSPDPTPVDPPTPDPPEPSDQSTDQVVLPSPGEGPVVPADRISGGPDGGAGDGLSTQLGARPIALTQGPVLAVPATFLAEPEGARTGVSISHTPELGAPSTTTTIPDVCGGTVYRTGVLPATP
ncbi:hypothetical protein [Streptomyces sp. NPDC060194]|uniref:hypothetical protein n=1 Tax=Streptomyces sp. NPDC060194 TaxID=3347069 RepID=UPI00364D68ED